MIFLPPLLSLKGEFILTSWGLVKCGGVSVSCYTSSGNNQYINQSKPCGHERWFEPSKKVSKFKFIDDDVIVVLISGAPHR